MNLQLESTGFQNKKKSSRSIVGNVAWSQIGKRQGVQCEHDLEEVIRPDKILQKKL